MSNLSANFRLQRAGFSLAADISIPGRGVTAVFGPSGSGKTTLLRCLAGLEPGARGQLRVDEEIWQDDARNIFIAPHRRAVGYVFQDARLFPHLSVRANLDYGRRRAKRDIGQAAAQMDHVVALLGLERLLERSPHHLSGGEQQRVAIGRALLSRPRLLLLDEPLAALDVTRKRDILPYLDKLRRELDIPLVYVSHAVDEVNHLADRLILIEDGRIRGEGAPASLLSRLEYPLAHSEEAAALIEARVIGHDDSYHLTELAFPGGRLTVARQAGSIGERVRVAIQARDVSITLSPPEHTSILNVLPATVTQISQEDPARVTVRLRLCASGDDTEAGEDTETDGHRDETGDGIEGRDETFLLARITRKSCESLALAPGCDVYAQVKSVALVG